jgi:GH24 family phage-related lysozyme (muramidase)
MLKLKKWIMGVLLIASPFVMAEEYKQIIKDEGIRYHVYLGPKGNLHAGVGHLLPDNGTYKIGQAVTLRQVSEWFWEDYAEAEEISEAFAPRAPKEVRDIITNMAFNLGETRLNTFTRMKKAVAEENWLNAAIEMQESYWFYDVGYRSKRLVNRMFNYGFVERSKTE